MALCRAWGEVGWNCHEKSVGKMIGTVLVSVPSAPSPCSSQKTKCEHFLVEGQA